MPYALTEVREKKPSKSQRKQRRIARASVQRNIKVHILDPLRLYEYECRMLMRLLAKWVYNRHYAPRPLEFARSHFFRPPALKRYLEDLETRGIVFKNPQGGYMLTREGYAQVHIEPIDPVLPSDPRSRKALIREARYVKKMLPQMESVMGVVS